MTESEDAARFEELAGELSRVLGRRVTVNAWTTGFAVARVEGWPPPAPIYDVDDALATLRALPSVGGGEITELDVVVALETRGYRGNVDQPP